eukprot:2882126-Pleurochrysis_carterae.AAC.7
MPTRGSADNHGTRDLYELLEIPRGDQASIETHLEQMVEQQSRCLALRSAGVQIAGEATQHPARRTRRVRSDEEQVNRSERPIS